MKYPLLALFQPKLLNVQLPDDPDDKDFANKAFHAVYVVRQRLVKQIGFTTCGGAFSGIFSRINIPSNIMIPFMGKLFGKRLRPNDPKARELFAQMYPGIVNTFGRGDGTEFYADDVVKASTVTDIIRSANKNYIRFISAAEDQAVKDKRELGVIRAKTKELLGLVANRQLSRVSPYVDVHTLKTVLPADLDGWYVVILEMEVKNEDANSRTDLASVRGGRSGQTANTDRGGKTLH